MRFLILIVTLIFCKGVHAQNSFDSAVFDNSFAFKNGIYTSLQELIYNSPSYPDSELELDKNQQSINLDRLYYVNSRGTRLKYESFLYATVVDGHLSIFYKNELSSVFLKGAISTFILKELVTTTHYPTYNNGLGQNGLPMTSMPYTTTSVETNIYFLDFQTGLIAKVDKDNLDPIIRRDPTLYESFRKIKGDSHHKNSYPFISQYNARNKIYIMILAPEDTEMGQ
ncbi:hypothetical protein [Cytophaga aurantiaca]|uniref:hypothetical protein n=1 Tax=Cytophaga aurantiaca TaxID=29530 RepID=UPI000362B6DF|nr:hypothetical protein [Cytophaga aurantiaca]